MVWRGGLAGLALFFCFPVFAQSPTVDVRAAIMADGSVLLEGQTYRDVESLKPKIAEINSRKPPVSFHVNARDGISFQAMNQAVQMLQKAGARMPIGVMLLPHAQ